MNEEQQLVAQAIGRGLHVVTAPPGCGKSYLVEAMTADLVHNQDKFVLLCAYTGAAAVRLSPCADTVHGTFGLPAGYTWFEELKTTSDTYALLKAADVIFVDEMSMLQNKQLCMIIDRLAQVTPEEEIWVNNKICFFSLWWCSNCS